ncbi:MAG TPA: glycosyltransferase family 4 protein [Patescibacteria group bacterium]|nr:glycosyltransferase family 4 protein [Patescibacteria group bacterium]
MAKVKVVEIIADSSLGGGSSHVFGLLKYLDKKKFEPFLICPEGQLSNRVSQISGVVIYHVPFKSKFDLISLFELRNFLARIKSSHDPFDSMVVHAHGPRAGFFTSAAAPRGAYRVYTEHRWDSDFHLKNSLNEFWQKKMLGRSLRKTNAVVAVSSSVKSFLIKNNLVTKAQIRIIPNAIELRTPSPEIRKIKTANRAPIIGTIGNLNLQKGQAYLIEAMPKVIKMFPLATLEIIGEGEERASLKSKVESLKLERHVTLLGRTENVEKYLQRWDVFVLPSIAETFGISILEAMSAGVPVVATKVGGIVDIIENKKNGLLVPREDPEALAKSTIEVLDHPAATAKLKRGGLERVKDFDWEKVIKEIEKVYSEPFDLEK